MLKCDAGLSLRDMSLRDIASCDIAPCSVAGTSRELAISSGGRVAATRSQGRVRQ